MSAPGATAAAVYELTPFIHVADVDASVRFYARFGFNVTGSMGHEDHLHWAFLTAGPGGAEGEAHLMLGSAETPIDRSAQGVLFYLYTHDLEGLRARLLQDGVTAGEIQYPDYLPAGEMRVVDPDGYGVMVGQRGTASA